MTSVTIKIDLETRPGEPECFRTVEVPLKATLDGLHRVITTLFQWSGELDHHFATDSGEQEDMQEVGDLLANEDDQVSYIYDQWTLTLSVIGTGGNQRSRAKLLTIHGPSPVEESNTIEGGWAAVWETLTALCTVREGEVLTEIYERMGQKQKDIVDRIGGVDMAEICYAERNDVDAKKLANRCYAHQLVSNPYSSGWGMQPWDSDLDDWGEGYSRYLASSAVERIVGNSRTAWDVAVQIVKRSSPDPFVVSALFAALKKHPNPDLTAAEIEAVVEPIRECARLVGSGNSDMPVEELVADRWWDFGTILGRDLSSPATHSHCIIPYLNAINAFGLLCRSWSGGLELSAMGRQLLATSDFCMDEMDRAQANRDMFSSIVRKFPFTSGRSSVFVVVSLGLLLCAKDLEEVAAARGMRVEEILDQTLAAVQADVRLTYSRDADTASTVVAAVLHVLDFSGFLDTN